MTREITYAEELGHRLGRLAAWVEGATDRLIRGTYLQRSTSLFAQARGEIEHEAVAEVLSEVRGSLRLALKGGAR